MADPIEAGPPIRLGGRPVGTPIRTGWDAPEEPRGSAGGHFTHVQTDPQSVVVVEHRLGFRPQVSLFSPDYSIKYRGFGVQHLDVNTLRISMDRPTAVAVVIS